MKMKIKKQERFHGIIDVDGNKGGDVLRIEDHGDGTVHLWSGHCCVVTINKTVPIEFITAILSQVMLEHDNDVNAIIDSFNWCDEFKAELKKKVK